MIGPVGDLASKLARTNFVPKALTGNPAGVAAAILTGRELGLGPMTSLRGIDIIEQKPALTAQMVAARILAAGHRITWTASTDQRATVKIERGDGLSEAEATWTMQDATRAGLAGRKVWQQYPRAMLRHRALTEAASMACPDVILGLDSAEAADLGDQPAVVRVVAAAPNPEPSGGVADGPSGRESLGGAEAAAPPETLDQPDPEIVAEELITPPQMRMIGALIGRWEQAHDTSLGRDERRTLIEAMAGLDPGTLHSAKDLTRVQASAAIDALQTAAAEHQEEPG